MYENENIQFDCQRGCAVSRDESGALNVTYRRGCCKLEDYNYLKGVGQEAFADLFEVRFKNTRKGIYRNTSGQSVKMGDMVIERPRSRHRYPGRRCHRPSAQMQGHRPGH